MKETLIMAIEDIQIERLGNAKITDITEDNLKPYLEQYKYYVENDTTNNAKIVTIIKDGIITTYMIDEDLNITEIDKKTKDIFTYKINSYENGKVNITVSVINDLGIENIIYPKDAMTINAYGKQEIAFDFNDIIELYDDTNNNEYEFTINLEDGTTETKKIKITLKELTQDQGEIILNPSTWTTSTTVEIKVKDTIIKDMSTSGLKIQYKEGEYGDTGWIDYTGTFDVDTNKKITARFVDSSNNEGYVFQKEISNIDNVEPQGTITLTKTWVGKGKNCTATVNISDSESGIDFTKSKYVFNQTATEIGKDISSYTGGSISASPEDIQVSSTTEGTYYIHVLATDNAGNSKEIISEAIEVKNIYEITTPEELQGMTDMTGTYYIMNDIDMSGYEFTTIDDYFEGTIDGQGYTISNLSMKPSKYGSYYYVGMFTNLRSGVTIKNLLIKNVNIDTNGISTNGVGVFCGKEGTSNRRVYFEKVGIEGTFFVGCYYGDCIGSFVGNGGINTYTDCYSRVIIKSVSDKDSEAIYSGGFQGHIRQDKSLSATLKNCYFAGKIINNNENNNFSYSKPFIGGFSTTPEETDLTNCYYNSEIFTPNQTTIAQGLSTSEMADASNYEGWDFQTDENDTEYTWYIDPDTGYPELHF